MYTSHTLDDTRASTNIKNIKQGEQEKTSFRKCDVEHVTQIQDSAGQGIPQDHKLGNLQVLIGWLKRSKKAVMNAIVKLRPQGMYMVLYGGRVNKQTFYNYRNQA